MVNANKYWVLKIVSYNKTNGSFVVFVSDLINDKQIDIEFVHFRSRLIFWKKMLTTNAPDILIVIVENVLILYRICQGTKKEVN